MKRACILPFWIVILCLAGCTSLAVPTPIALPTPTQHATLVLGTTLADPSVTPRPNSVIDPTRQASPRSTALPVTMVVPTPIPLIGWGTFISARWHVAVDYPLTWSVHELPEGVTFSSAQGEIIRFAPVTGGALSPEGYLNQEDLPNTHCSTFTNAYNQVVRDCFDTIARSHSAESILSLPGGQTELLTLATAQRGNVQVFNAMAASLRLVP